MCYNETRMHYDGTRMSFVEKRIGSDPLGHHREVPLALAMTFSGAPEGAEGVVMVTCD